MTTGAYKPHAGGRRLWSGRRGRTATQVYEVVMSCDRFIELYTDYRDGVLTPALHAEVEEHLEECPCCERYHRVMQRGLEILSSVPSAESSDDFMPRLRHRLYNVDCGITEGRRRFGGSAALIGVAAVGLLALFWLPFAATVPVEMELAPVSAHAPPPGAEEVPALFRSGPFVSTLLLEDETYLDGELQEFEWSPRLQAESAVAIEASYLKSESTLLRP